jgi:uncharacterized protein YecT (DUF1311 family)
LSPSLRCSFVSLSIILLCSGVPFAQSFDCAKAKSKVEKKICASEELKELDVELDRLYRQLLNDPKKNKGRIRGWQRYWLEFRERDVEDNLTKIYEDRIIEFSVWLRETSPGATPVNPNPSPKWRESEKELIAKMFETYKRDGFDYLFTYAADKISCTDEMINFFKLNFEPIDPIAVSNDPYDPTLQKAMGACGKLDIASEFYHWGGETRGFIGGYEIYAADFDDMEGDEVLLVGKKSRAVSFDYSDGKLIYKNIFNYGRTEASFFLFNTSDNCTNSFNNDKSSFFLEKDQEDIYFAEPRYAMWQEDFYPLYTWENFIYGVARYGGRAYVYMLTATDNNSYGLSISRICRGDINVFDIPQK